MKRIIKIGDYVFASKHSDGDPKDPWYIGTLKEIIIDIRGKKYKVDGSERLWKHVKLITKEDGEEILSIYPKLEGSKKLTSDDSDYAECKHNFEPRKTWVHTCNKCGIIEIEKGHFK